MLTETLGRLRKASEEYFGLLEKGLSSSPLPIADQAKQFCDFMQRNVTATFDLGDKLTQAKDMQDVLKMQSDFFQDQMRALTDQGKSLGESAMRAATGAFTQKLAMLLPHGRATAPCWSGTARKGDDGSILARKHRCMLPASMSILNVRRFLLQPADPSA